MQRVKLTIEAFRKYEELADHKDSLYGLRKNSSGDSRQPVSKKKMSNVDELRISAALRLAELAGEVTQREQYQKVLLRNVVLKKEQRIPILCQKCINSAHH
jgi:hypothetical protein